MTSHALMNRLGNVHNPYQGEFKKVLCVCSAGLLRSPTAALVLSQEPFNCNTRAAGVESNFALVPVDQVLLTWAEEIVCMEREHADDISVLLKKYKLDRRVVCLDIPDRFEYRDEKLRWLIKEKYQLKLGEQKAQYSEEVAQLQKKYTPKKKGNT